MDIPPAYWHFNGVDYVFTWLERAPVPARRVYGLAFTDGGRILLVAEHPYSEHFLLPGGGVEEGEQPEDALSRELIEEAAAGVVAMEPIGAQRVECSDGRPVEYHAYYWCRVTLAEEFVPEHEIVRRVTVEPAEFLDRLFWGRSDAKATLLLQRALACDARHR